MKLYITMKSINPKAVNSLILHWFDQHGRKQLPWQYQKTPYRVWVSEIMLQQTQVHTVIPYFEKFMQHFPHLAALAEATEDEVLHLWTGLGYYSRARNLHRAAKMVMTEFKGEFPNNSVDLQSLPGIGRSTAGAILSIAFNQSEPILDGNVKRVLTRLHGITKPINEKETENKLWELALSYTPTQRAADYTQAIMDLGATCCTRNKPQCEHCPLMPHCVAYAEEMTTQIPKKKSTKTLPTHAATFLILNYDGQVLLHKRPPTGIWGGLWSFPEIKGHADSELIRETCQQSFKISITTQQPLPSFRHTFSHYHLDISPVLIPLKRFPSKVMEANKQIWYKITNPEPVGLPKPVQLIMSKLA
jgi:A/G-specific adenine glycosylase